MVTLLNTVDDSFASQICRDHGDKPDELLEILNAVQASEGYLSDSVLRTIADALNISRAEVHGVVTFYHDYKREPGAKVTIKICRAEACQAAGVQDLIGEAEVAFGTTLDAKATEIGLEAAYCLGNCALGPAVMIDEQLYGKVDVKRLKHLAMKHLEGRTAT